MTKKEYNGLDQTERWLTFCGIAGIKKGWNKEQREFMETAQKEDPALCQEYINEHMKDNYYLKK